MTVSKVISSLKFTDCVQSNDFSHFLKWLELNPGWQTQSSPHFSPLFTTLNHHRPLMAQCLIAQGADIGQRDEADNTPLMKAVELGYTHLILELASPLLINRLNHQGLTALHLACQYQALDTVVELIQLGAKVNQGIYQPGKEQHGYTPLMFAVLADNEALVDVLLSLGGANINQTNARGEHSLILAAQRSMFSMVAFLTRRGSNLTLMDQTNQTAINYCMKHARDGQKQSRRVAQVMMNRAQITTPPLFRHLLISLKVGFKSLINSFIPDLSPMLPVLEDPVFLKKTPHLLTGSLDAPLKNRLYDLKLAYAQFDGNPHSHSTSQDHHLSHLGPVFPSQHHCLTLYKRDIKLTHPMNQKISNPSHNLPVSLTPY